MNTIYFQKPLKNGQEKLHFHPVSIQKFLLKRHPPILNENDDDFIHGDFTNNISILALNNWSKMHFKKRICLNWNGQLNFKN